jgi:internalin A
MTAVESQAAAPPSKLRWYQYRLRSLFILTTLVAIACSWLAVTMQNQRKQKAVAEVLRKAGAEVTTEPTWLGTLVRDDTLVRVSFVGWRAKLDTDAEMVHLQGLDQLKSLYLYGTHASDAGLMHLHGLSQLKELILDYTEVTDAGLGHLRELKQLEWLALDNTKVTDAGIVYLQGLSQLKDLRLRDTKVTDAALAHLDGLSQLRVLDLRNTKVTDQGVKKLQQTLPKCRIMR